MNTKLQQKEKNPTNPQTPTSQHSSIIQNYASVNAHSNYTSYAHGKQTSYSTQAKIPPNNIPYAFFPDTLIKLASILIG